jgi:hypothetical protein
MAMSIGTKVREYAKFLTAAVGAAATIVTVLDVHATWVPVVLAVATALGVGAVPNRHQAPVIQPITMPPAAPQAVPPASGSAT